MACISHIVRMACVALPLGMSYPAAAEMQPVDQIADAYTGDQRYEIVDLEKRPLVERLDQSLLDVGLARKDADVTALEKALLLVDLEEEPLSRVRYSVRVSMRVLGDVPVTFVQVDRYNLGPAVRADTIEAYGEENTADASSFGIGPHVGWRFVMQPTAKAAAILLSAGRREISEDEAVADSCFGRTCLSLDPADDVKDWKDAASGDFTYPKMAYPPTTVIDAGDERVEQEVTAHVALEMAASLGLASVNESGVLWTFEPPEGFGPQSPFLAMVIDRNLGQEIMTDAIMGLAKVDKDVDDRWVRRTSGVFEGVSTIKFQQAAGPM